MKNRTAIDFSLDDKFGNINKLSNIKSKYKVIYFYPSDNTPGCTIQSKEFSDLISSFKKLDAEIIGISGGDKKSKEKFCSQHNLKLLLLSDTDFSVSKSYKVYGEKSFMGRKFLGIKRTTFILNKDNKIIEVFENVKPLGHAAKVLDYVKNINF